MAPLDLLRSLRAAIVHGKSAQHSMLDINSSPVDLENNLFRGKMVLTTDASGTNTEGTSLALQLQGRFKRPPQGKLWFGAEVSKPMELGWFSDSICQVLFAIMKPWTGDSLYWSFGDVNRGGYLSAPASSVCNVLVTSPDEKAPTLGSQHLTKSFHLQDPMQAAQVLGDESLVCERVFTFSFTCQFMDLFRWEIVNIPGVGSLSLDYFWGNQREFHLTMFEAASGDEHKRRNCVVDVALMHAE
eukprot:gnl/MRDRNA2_/MRDRNA2_35959_c0_seq1.p1 gnl/MRDRNA2_/MRDRNA2_35959_c0~~gnl/MRDRNA2_/MRDRNA2_35959_c0_seq1.p1  ORF type:complete len:258 (-),score=36.60 gnl/MRDRNA2_/MRDRNA2_35959_c0_seq1:221-949(-)